MEEINNLPITREFHQIAEAWSSSSHFIIKSPTGSGKSIALPILLKEEKLVEEQILVLQPRRIAARLLAKRVSYLKESPIGEYAGYQVRLDAKYSKKTEILYLTDGIAFQKITHDSQLRGVGAVIFDEFHQRSVYADYALAHCIKIWKSYRPDLRIFITSATIDLNKLQKYLPVSKTVELQSRNYPVEIVYKKLQPKIYIWDAVSEIIKKLIKQTGGNILVFLEGVFQIKKTIKVLTQQPWSAGFEVLPLFGEMPDIEQDKINKTSSKRKIIVSTNIAETSITIEGVSIVIDSGRAKKSKFDPGRGINSLQSYPISKSSSDQRAGRAGRTADGYCIRLWGKNEHEQRDAFETPEILCSDLSQIYLNIIAKGDDPRKVNWLETPPAEITDQSYSTLADLGAIDQQSHISNLGAELSRLPLHPKLSYALLISRKQNCAPVMALLLAMLDDRLPIKLESLGDFYPSRTIPSDPYCLLLAYEEASRRNFDHIQCKQIGIHASRLLHAEKVAKSLCSIVSVPYNLVIPSAESLGKLLVLCFPSNLAKLSSIGRLIYQGINGKNLHLSSYTSINPSEWVLPLRIIEKPKKGNLVREMELNTTISSDIVHELYASKIFNEEEILFDHTSRNVIKRNSKKIGNIVLSSHDDFDISADDRAKGLSQAILDGELTLKHWNHSVLSWMHRIIYLTKKYPDLKIIPFDEEFKQFIIEQTCLRGSTWRQIKNTEIIPIIKEFYSPEELCFLSEYAPPSIQLSNGTRHYKIDYSDFNNPSIQVTLQNLYDIHDHPSIGYPSQKLLIEVLAPNKRVVQRTQDLTSFWQTSYPLIKKELAGRYPKHEWR